MTEENDDGCVDSVFCHVASIMNDVWNDACDSSCISWLIRFSRVVNFFQAYCSPTMSSCFVCGSHSFVRGNKEIFHKLFLNIKEQAKLFCGAPPIVSVCLHTLPRAHHFDNIALHVHRFLLAFLL